MDFVRNCFHSNSDKIRVGHRAEITTAIGTETLDSNVIVVIIA